jgi:hypothetical protein
VQSILSLLKSVSSATIVEDDGKYLASRGSTLCSLLLHAMAQIDSQIREPLSYTDDVCATIMAPQQLKPIKPMMKVKKLGYMLVNL